MKQSKVFSMRLNSDVLELIGPITELLKSKKELIHRATDVDEIILISLGVMNDIRLVYEPINENAVVILTTPRTKVKNIREKYKDLYEYMLNSYEETGVFPAYNYLTKVFKVSKGTINQVKLEIQPGRMMSSTSHSYMDDAEDFSPTDPGVYG